MVWNGLNFYVQKIKSFWKSIHRGLQAIKHPSIYLFLRYLLFLICKVASERIQGLLEAYLKIKKQWWARTIIYYSCEGGIEKSVPQDLRFPNGDPRDGFFYPTLTLMIDSYILKLFWNKTLISSTKNVATSSYILIRVFNFTICSY